MDRFELLLGRVWRDVRVVAARDTHQLHHNAGLGGIVIQESIARLVIPVVPEDPVGQLVDKELPFLGVLGRGVGRGPGLI